MATISRCRCSKCNYYISISNGILMRSYKDKEFMQAALRQSDSPRGELMRQHPDAGIDIMQYVYMCPECGELRCEKSMNLYAHGQDGRRQLLDERQHICSKCKAHMNRIGVDKFRDMVAAHEIKCPVCGAELQNDHSLMIFAD